MSTDTISKDSSTRQGIEEDLGVRVDVRFSPAYRDQFDILARGIYTEKITGNLSIEGFEVDRDKFGDERFDVLLNGKLIYSRTLRPYLSTPRTEDVVQQVQNQYKGASVFEIDRSK